MSIPASRGSPDILPSAAAADTSRSLGRFARVMLPLGLALAVVYEFAIEERRQLPAVFALAVAAFAVHYWLPRKLRMPLFLAASLASIGLVLEWQDALYVVVLGLGLIGICWLPVSPRLRIALLLLAAGNLAVWRSGTDHAFWPILGAMFMFRLILYVFDTTGQERREPLATLSYFFLLPNACFTLFPVIDYTTFRRTYYDRPEHEIYQTGLLWICRGLTHLLLYRWIKYFLLPAPHEIDDLPHLALFLAANYALYLRVSGQFHLITGLLHMFGFNLPPTHHLYFLATSFTDIWRRINIYWKDFMQKVFFFPVFFRLRRLGTFPAMLLATAGVFLATWLLHSYQHFWLLGKFPLTQNDAALWLIVGALVAINALLDLRRARRAAAAPHAWSWTHAAASSLKALGMFAAVSVFWGRWTHPELFAHLNLSLLRSANAQESAAWVAGILTTAVVLGPLVAWLWRELYRRESFARWRALPASTAMSISLLTAVVWLGQTHLYQEHAPRLAGALSGLKQDMLTPLEASQLAQGYYEEITEADLQSQAFMGREARGPASEHLTFSAMTRPTDDVRLIELIPGWKGSVQGTPLSINRWGMRDRELPQKKPPGSYRVALLGSSTVMGYGVRDDEVFDVLLEERLNAAQAPGKSTLELLNFGTGQAFAIQRRLLLEQKVFDFQPDTVYYFAHQDEFMGSSLHLAEISYKKFKLADACLEGLLHDAGVMADTSWGLTQSLLTTREVPIVDCCYRRIVIDCRSRGIPAWWIYLPMPGFDDAPVQGSDLIKLAEQAGFVVADLGNWANGYSPEEVKFGVRDPHPNALGHQVIAERLFDAIRQRPELLPAFAPERQPPGSD